MADNINSSNPITYRAGDTFGVYCLLGELGHGEKSTTFKARHQEQETYFAVKIYRELSEITEKLYKYEVQTYQLLQNVPGILELRDYGILNNCYFVVTDYVKFGTLRELMAERTKGFELSELLPLFTQIANTLDHIHNRGIVHRDLKPENILLNKIHHNYYQAFIVDFAVARKTNITGSFNVTDFSGTWSYSAPEVWSTNPITKAVDIYAFGLMLYEAFEGRHPFPIPAKTPQDIEKRFVPYPVRVKQIANEEVVNIILQSLDKKPENRSSSAKEIIDGIHKSVKSLYPEFGYFIGQKYNDRYVVVDVIGQGMASISLLACDCRTEKLVVLKIFTNIDYVSMINSEDAFNKEIKNLERIRPANGESLPAILLPIESFTEKGSFFIVTEYQAGGSLRHVLNEKLNKQLSLKEVMEIFTPIAKAIDYVHSQQVIHRDIKPENILYHEEAGKKIIFLTDFGISGILEGTKVVLSTKHFSGTRPYMAPELLPGLPKTIDTPEITKAVDIFAFGSMIYEALTGSLSVEYDDLDKIPSQLEGQAAGEIIRKARSRTPKERPESALEIIEGLQKIHAGAPSILHDDPSRPPTGSNVPTVPNKPPVPQKWRVPFWPSVAISSTALLVFFVLIAAVGISYFLIKPGLSPTPSPAPISESTPAHTPIYKPSFTLTSTRGPGGVMATPYVIVSSGNIDCHTDPVQSSRVVHTIRLRESITVLGRYNDWLLITDQDLDHACWIKNTSGLITNLTAIADIPTVAWRSTIVVITLTPTHDSHPDGTPVPPTTNPPPKPTATVPPPKPTNTPDGPRACNDGIDNDGDGKIDFPNDPGCRNQGDDSE